MIQNVTFKGGAHIEEHKEFSEAKPIELQVLPSVVHIPLLQGSGSVNQPLVKKGDRVLKGQLIGSSEATFGSPVHSSVSGTVLEISPRYTAEGKRVDCITIERDDLDEAVEFVSKNVEGNPEAKYLVSVAREAGITGMGGGGFPFAVKLNGAINNNIDSILANGAECEPYLTSDHRAMVEHPAEVVSGVSLVVNALGCNAGYIAIEDNKPDAISAVDSATNDFSKVEVASMQTKFPQGDSTRVIDSVLNRKVPVGERSGAVGAFVSNVNTFRALHNAYYNGIPLFERVISVTGPGVKEPKNILTRIGTPIIDLINQCGGFNGDVVAVISGGPMNGDQIFDLESPVTKNITGIVVLTKEYMDTSRPTPCIKCDKCVSVCPSRLNPQRLEKLILHGKYDDAKAAFAEECIQCGACSYVCPAKRQLAQNIKLGMNEIWARN